MLLIIDQSLTAWFIPINTWQQRASLPLKPGVLERKVYSKDDIPFFSLLTFVKPVLQPSRLHGLCRNTLSHSGSAYVNVNTRKRTFIPLNKSSKLLVYSCLLQFILDGQ